MGSPPSFFSIGTTKGCGTTQITTASTLTTQHSARLIHSTAASYSARIRSTKFFSGGGVYAGQTKGGHPFTSALSGRPSPSLSALLGSRPYSRSSLSLSPSPSLSLLRGLLVCRHSIGPENGAE